MGVASLREAFNSIASPRYTANMALMSTERAAGAEYSRLTFRGIGADGATFEIVSDPISPGADVILASKATAQKLIDPPAPPAPPQEPPA